MLAEDAESNAQRLLAIATVLTGAIADPRVDDDVVADGDILHIVADSFHDSRAVGPEHPTRCDVEPGEAADDEKVQMVERCRTYPKPNVGSSLEGREREIVAQFDAIQIAVSRNGEAFHKNGTVIFKAFSQRILTSPADWKIVGAALRKR
jgi:hypothetical protein